MQSPMTGSNSMQHEEEQQMNRTIQSISNQSNNIMDTSSSTQSPPGPPFDGRIRACYVGQQFMLNLDQVFKHGHIVSANIHGTQLRGAIFTSPCSAKVTAMRANQVIEPILQRRQTMRATDADVVSRLPPVVDEQQPVEYQAYQTYEPTTYTQETPQPRTRKPRKSKATDGTDSSLPTLPSVSS